MGFFSEIVGEARRGMTTPARQTAAPPVAPKPAPAPPVAAPEAPAVQPAPTPPVPAEAVIPPPEVKLTVAEDTAQDDTAAREAHEAAEAKRKAEWDAKQAEKKAARQKQLDKIAVMNSAELLAAAVGRVAADTEKLTRRNMKGAVAEHIQARCREDAAFAMLVMDPGKSMVNCFQYINRKAREYAEQEMKDNGIERRGTYGCDVPDGLVYQWAEDYFNDPDASEDHVNEEKFIPRTYVSKSGSSRTKKAKPKTAPKKPAAAENVSEQISLM